MQRVNNPLLLTLCLFSFSIVQGCAPGLISKPELLRDQLGFLEVGKTTEQEVLARMGEPTNRYEGGKVLTYRLREDTRDRFHPPSNETSTPEEPFSFTRGIFYLILVFDENKILEKDALLYSPHTRGT